MARAGHRQEDWAQGPGRGFDRGFPELAKIELEGSERVTDWGFADVSQSIPRSSESLGCISRIYLVWLCIWKLWEGGEENRLWNFRK